MINTQSFRLDADGYIIDKDPQAVLDYGLDWALWLSESNSDSIQSSTWVSAPSGLTHGTTTNNAGITSVYLSGGTVGSVYTVTNHITTVGGRQDDRSFRVRVVER